MFRFLGFFLKKDVTEEYETGFSKEETTSNEVERKAQKPARPTRHGGQDVRCGQVGSRREREREREVRGAGGGGVGKPEPLSTSPRAAHAANTCERMSWLQHTLHVAPTAGLRVRRAKSGSHPEPRALQDPRPPRNPALRVTARGEVRMFDWSRRDK